MNRKACLLVLLVVICTSCENRGKGDNEDDGWVEDTTLYRQSTTGLKLTPREEDILQDVLEMNGEQILWLQNGLKFGTDEGMKMHARKMLDDHMKMDSLYRDYASTKAISLEKVDSTKEFYLDEKIGNEWNEEWSDVIKEKHRRFIRRIERADRHVQDSTLKALNTSHLPILRSHRDIAAELEEQFDQRQ
jgi:hypothetical protein